MRKLRPTASLQAFLAAAGVFIGVAHAQSMELQTQVEALVESGPSEIQGARIAHPKLIHAYYSQRAFRPAWTARTAGELMRAVVDSEADGLDPGDYHLAVLRQLGDPAAGGGNASGFSVAAYEILHTDALLRLADHLSFGKVDPTSFDPHWNYGRMIESTDVPQKIENALTSGDLYAEIEKLKPTHRMYQTLKKELVRFREVAARPNGSRSRRARRSNRTATMNACCRYASGC